MNVNDEVQDDQADYLSHLLGLRMLTSEEAGTGVPQYLVAEVMRATRAVLAEAEAAGRSDRAGNGGRDERSAEFLRVRLNRLTAAAAETIAAARQGNPAELHRKLRRFEALASAIWVVQAGIKLPLMPA